MTGPVFAQVDQFDDEDPFAKDSKPRTLSEVDERVISAEQVEQIKQISLYEKSLMKRLSIKSVRSGKSILVLDDVKALKSLGDELRGGGLDPAGITEYEEMVEVVLEYKNAPSDDWRPWSGLKVFVLASEWYLDGNHNSDSVILRVGRVGGREIEYGFRAKADLLTFKSVVKFLVLNEYPMANHDGRIMPDVKPYK